MNDIFPYVFCFALLLCAGVFIYHYFLKVLFFFRRKKHKLLHYTTIKNARSIMQTQSVKAGKDGQCYFFVGEEVSLSKLEKNKLENTTAVIVVRGVSAEQAKRYSFDLRYDVFCHKDDFCFCEDNAVIAVHRKSFKPLTILPSNNRKRSLR